MLFGPQGGKVTDFRSEKKKRNKEKWGGLVEMDKKVSIDQYEKKGVVRRRWTGMGKKLGGGGGKGGGGGFASILKKLHVSRRITSGEDGEYIVPCAWDNWWGGEGCWEAWERRNV